MMRTTGEYPSSIRLPNDLKKTLALASKKQGCSVSFKITEILRRWEKWWLVKQGDVEQAVGESPYESDQ